jgi:uncharacterized spore protein YtfJ
MKDKMLKVLLAGLLLVSLGGAQNPPEKKPQAARPQPAHELADALAQRLGSELNVKTAVGEPIKAGAVTLIPIMMININFGGGGMSVPVGQPAAQPALTPQPAKPALGGDGFYMSGEARPLGFVAITKNGTRFISVGKAAGK